MELEHKIIIRILRFIYYASTEHPLDDKICISKAIGNAYGAASFAFKMPV